MADLATLEKALRNADAAGDTDAAKVFAAEIMKMRGSTQAEPQWSDLPGNIIPSAIEAGKGMAQGVAQAVMHPNQTAAAVNDILTGAENKIPGVLAVKQATGWGDVKPETLAQQDQTANTAWQALKDRYGSPENIKRTLIQDPAGAALDASTIIGGAGLAARARSVPAATRIAGQTRTSEAILRKLAPKDVHALDNLGDEAMVLDASPGMTGLAQGVAATPSTSADRIIEALTSRHADRSNRLVSDTTQTLGKLRDPKTLHSIIDYQSQKQAAPLYSASKANPPVIGPQQVGNTFSNEMTLSGRKVMDGITAALNDAINAPDPKTAWARLHNLRKELDAQIVYGKDDFSALSSADKAAQGPLKEARKTIDSILKTDPKFAQADDIVSEGARAKEAVDLGYDALDGGKSAIPPKSLAGELNRLDPAFVEHGMKARIGNAMGTSGNDMSALNRIIGDGNDFNRQKLVQVFGQQKTDALVNSVNREQKFSQNYADIDRNSQTARRLEAQKIVQGPDQPKVTGSETAVGLSAKGLAMILNSLIGKAVGKYSSTNAEAIANALALKGSDARNLLVELNKGRAKGSKSRAIVEALGAAHGADLIHNGAR